IKNLTEWRFLTNQDVHSQTGDPQFGSDSLHLPAASTYIYSPATANGAFINTGTQRFDFDGDDRSISSVPNIGADEVAGFQYTNDLAVMTITKPSGITDNAGVINVTAENPLPIQAIVKNEGLIKAFNRNVYSKVEVSTDNGATWLFYNPPAGGGSSFTQ